MPRTGRPTEDPKTNRIGFRLSDKDIEKLNYCSEILGIAKTEVVRKGIDKIYKGLLRKNRK